MEAIEEAIINDLDKHEKIKALELIQKSDPNSEIAKLLKKTIKELDALDVPRDTILVKTKDHFKNLLNKIVSFRYFLPILTLILFLQTLIFPLIFLTDFNPLDPTTFFTLTFSEQAIILISGIAILFLLLGTLLMKRSTMVKRSLKHRT